MKNIFSCLGFIALFSGLQAQVRQTESTTSRVRDTIIREPVRTDDNRNNRRGEIREENNNRTGYPSDAVRVTQAVIDRVVFTEQSAVSSEDTAAVFMVTTPLLDVRAVNGRVPVQKITSILQLTKNKPPKVTLSAKHPQSNYSVLRFGGADINFEEDKANFIYRIDPRDIILEKSSQIVSPQGGISSTSEKYIIKLDQRSYEFFNGFVGAKVNFQKNQKYLVQFSVESKKVIDYTVWISKEYKEIFLTSSGIASLPIPNQHFFYSGNKKISLVVEPGDYEGNYYIILAGNCLKGNWTFRRFDMTALDE